MFYPAGLNWQKNITVKTFFLSAVLSTTVIARIGLATVMSLATILTAGSHQPLRSFAANQFKLAYNEAVAMADALQIFIRSFGMQSVIEPKLQVTPSILFNPEKLTEETQIKFKKTIGVEKNGKISCFKGENQDRIEQALLEIQTSEKAQLTQLQKIQSQTLTLAEEWSKGNGFFKGMTVENLQDLISQTKIAEEQTGIIDHSKLHQFSSKPRIDAFPVLCEYPKQFTSKYTSYTAATMGRRDKMEDAFVGTRLNFFKNLKQHSVLFTAVLDGHGGDQTVGLVYDNIINIFQKCLKNEKEMNMQSIMRSLNQTCEDLHRNSPDTSGTTATIVLLIDDKHLITANVGDSLALLAHGDKIVSLTRDATYGDPIYMQELQNTGATIARYFEKIELSNGQTYIHVHYRNDNGNGILAPGRTIGDKTFPHKSHLPIFTYRELSQEELESGMIISATDGISTLSKQDIMIALQNDQLGENPAKRILNYAFQKGSVDNILVNVVYLRNLKKQANPAA